jgi:nucleoside-diphosphate-sugar epimerase
LLARGHAVSVLTRAARPVPAGAETLVADRRDAGALAAALGGRRFDVALDLLAYDGGDVVGLWAVPRFDVARYLIVSSGQVYLVGAGPKPPFRESDADSPLMPEPGETAPDHGNWEYGAGKRDAERAARDLLQRGIRVTALRLPVVQGAQDSSRRLWAYLERLRDGGPLLLPGTGDDPVRFVWAEDVARAVVTLAEGAPATAPAYNLAQPDEPSLREMVATAAEILGVRARIVPCPWETLAQAGLDRAISPFSGPWCSRPEPSLARRDWGFEGTPTAGWLPEVVRAHLMETDPVSHPGYATREAERALAGRLGAG